MQELKCSISEYKKELERALSKIKLLEESDSLIGLRKGYSTKEPILFEVKRASLDLNDAGKRFRKSLNEYNHLKY